MINMNTGIYEILRDIYDICKENLLATPFLYKAIHEILMILCKENLLAAPFLYKVIHESLKEIYGICKENLLDTPLPL